MYADLVSSNLVCPVRYTAGPWQSIIFQHLMYTINTMELKMGIKNNEKNFIN